MVLFLIGLDCGSIHSILRLLENVIYVKGLVICVKVFLVSLLYNYLKYEMYFGNQKWLSIKFKIIILTKTNCSVLTSEYFMLHYKTIKFY